MRRVEERTAGLSGEALEAGEEAFGDAIVAMNGALRVLMATAAPDLAAFGRKVVLAVDHDVASLNGGAGCMAALGRDALRFCSGQAPFDVAQGRLRVCAG